MKPHFFPLVAVVAIMASCVPVRRFDSLHAELIEMQNRMEQTQTTVEEYEAKVNDMALKNNQLLSDIARRDQKHADLQDKYNTLADADSRHTAQLEQKARNDAARVAELERLLKIREEALANIKNKVTEALTGFQGQGLTVTRRDGQIYVSMDDKLLFESGSWQIGSRGQNAVRDLAAVLERNTDISIMVEGHTDDVPYKGRGNLDDNLDLSAKRATEVVRLLLRSGNIDPARVVAAGRGEWLPVTMGTTPEARSRNRRTEIILSPRLDELMKLMQ